MSFISEVYAGELMVPIKSRSAIMPTNPQAVAAPTAVNSMNDEGSAPSTAEQGYEDRQKEFNTHRPIMVGVSLSKKERNMFKACRGFKAPDVNTPVGITKFLSAIQYHLKHADLILTIMKGPHPVDAYHTWCTNTVKQFQDLKKEERPHMVYADAMALYLQLLRQIAQAHQDDPDTPVTKVERELIQQTAALMLFISKDTAGDADMVAALLHRLAVSYRAPEVFTPAAEKAWVTGTEAMPAEESLIPARASGPIK